MAVQCDTRCKSEFVKQNVEAAEIQVPEASSPEQMSGAQKRVRLDYEANDASPPEDVDTEAFHVDSSRCVTPRIAQSSNMILEATLDEVAGRLKKVAPTLATVENPQMIAERLKQNAKKHADAEAVYDVLNAKDCYAVLSVDETKPESWKKGYHNWTKTTHPDKNENLGAKEAYQRVESCWQILQQKLKLPSPLDSVCV